MIAVANEITRKSNLPRSVFFLLFLVVYVIFLIYRVYINPFEINSDIEQYFHHYQESGNILVFGFEFFVPILFFLSNYIGLDFYGFSFLYSIFCIIPIFYLSRRISLFFLSIYYLFFVLWFIPNNIFLLRQYISFGFLTLFLLGGQGKNHKILLFFSIFSHLSAIFIYAASFIGLKKQSPFFLLGIFSIILFLLQIDNNFMGPFLFDLMSPLLEWDFGFDFNRKIYGQISIVGEELGNVIPSFSVLLLLSFSVFIHSVEIFKFGESDKLMRVFYFSACLSLIFASINVLSNRLGFAAYFFSVPYFLLVLGRVNLEKLFRLHK